MYLLFEIANYICILCMHTLYMQLFSFKLAWLWILGAFPAEKNLNNSVFFKWFLKLFSPKHFAILKYVLLFCLLRKCLSVAYFVPKSARSLLTSSLGYHHSLFLFVILKWYLLIGKSCVTEKAVFSIEQHDLVQSDLVSFPSFIK